MHSSAVHNAIRVDSLIWLGSLVSNADTDADDSSRPALSASSRRSWAPVHTSRCAAAIRSFHLIFMHAGSSPVSSLTVAVTARRYASSMNVADGRTYRIVELTVQ